MEFGLRANDAATLSAWVQKHTGPCGSANSKEYYWDSISNIGAVKVSGRDALSFDRNLQACGSSVTVHQTAFVLRRSYIFLLGWWSSEAAYLATVERAADGILGSVRG